MILLMKTLLWTIFLDYLASRGDSDVDSAHARLRAASDERIRQLRQRPGIVKREAGCPPLMRVK